MLWNNHGWSLKEMLFLTSILLLAMLVVVFLINSLYNNLEAPKDNVPSKIYSYQDIENNLKEAAKKYYKKEERNVITSEDLLEKKYIDLKKLTSDKDVCEGYVLVEEKEFTPFITCTNYETEGY